jgi:hypothetical protein
VALALPVNVRPHLRLSGLALLLLTSAGLLPGSCWLLTPAGGPANNAVTVELAADVPGAAPILVAVHDRSGWLVQARAATSDEWYETAPQPGEEAMLVSILGPGMRTFLVRWWGTPCDASADLVIGRAVQSLAITLGPIPGCAAAAVGRGLVLTFDQDVDPSAIRVSFDPGP